MNVLMIGSGHSALEYPKYKSKKFLVVAVNNAWQVTDDWTFWIRPGDYVGKTPTSIRNNQSIISGIDYNKVLNKFGGVQNCGFSIMLNASYWVLDTLKPSTIYYLGADMNYTPKDGKTHFYGIGHDIKTYGESDPDRMIKVYKQRNPNPSNNYLNDIYMRFYKIAQEHKTVLFNLSSDPDSRLPYPKIII